MWILRLKLHWQILIALVLALSLGMFVQLSGALEAVEEPAWWAGALLSSCEFIGELFMSALKMIVVPLIVSTVICGVMAIGSEKHFGRMGLKTLLYYSVTGLLAIVTGLLLVNLIRPGVVSPETAQAIVGQQQSPEEFMDQVEGRGAGDLVDVFLRMVPPNIFEAAADNGQLLGLITVSLLFGYFASKLPEKHRTFQTQLWESFQELMMVVTDFIIRFAPIGVFGLVTPIIARTGFDLFKPILLFFITVMSALLIHFLVNLGLLLRFVGKVNPMKHYKAMAPVLLMSFSTASSSATLPVTLETVQKGAGVSNRTSSFTLPLGATVNMDGTALYECVVVIFIAQIYGVLEGFQIGLVTQFSVVLLALLTSVGVAGIPSASLVAITVILTAVGLPIEAVGIVWVTDRILDMCRTSVNVFSDTVGAVVIGRTEGEQNIYADEAMATG